MNMKNTSETTTNETIEFIRIYIICRWFYLIVFGIGITGNILNIVVFLRKKFRSNSCSIYFIAYSINNFMNLTFGLFVWSLTLGFGFDLEYTVLTYCKIRRYLTHVNYLVSSCLLTMASINRYARVRQAQLTKNLHRYIFLCESQTTYIIIISTVVFCLIVNVHIPIFFEINQNECYARIGVYRILFDVYFLLFYAVLPPLIMVIVNIATVRHIRCIKKLVNPCVSRREYHFIVLVIAHSLSNIIFTLPYTINKFVYYTFEDLKPTEKEKLIGAVTLLIAFMNPGFSFFLYTLTTRSFRHEFIQACKDIFIRKDSNSLINKVNDTIGARSSLPMNCITRGRLTF
ncbi:unnamed protein product [Rotaria socialis]|uniref:G-protein coupled receptors family 1 profile domain-containing protein n=1 Tax=Rotaria socialis TaxID=392032 RepID=A0A820GXK6_9BILA|nr:unnamed protein product [Rotaria socialis]CAF4284564.1 unnamed protein product [Rotaria socialis]